VLNIDEIDIWSQFHQHFTQVFLYKSELSSFSLLTFGFVIFWRKNIGAKSLCKMLMKLTHGLAILKIWVTTLTLLTTPKRQPELLHKNRKQSYERNLVFEKTKLV